jgi:hypothetical protein
MNGAVYLEVRLKGVAPELKLNGQGATSHVKSYDDSPIREKMRREKEVVSHELRQDLRQLAHPKPNRKSRTAPNVGLVHPNV